MSNNLPTPPPTPALTREELVSMFQITLQSRSPFIGTLALFTKYVPSTAIRLAKTDGLHVKYNPDVLINLTLKEVNWVLARQVIHCMLRHPARGKLYDRELWGIACSLYVNDRILWEFSTQTCVTSTSSTAKGPWCSRPHMDLTWPELTNKCESAEEVYLALLEMPKEEIDGHVGDAWDSELDDPEGTGKTDAELDDHWKRAANSAQNRHNSSKDPGNLPGGLTRALEEMNDPQIPWQQVLANYVIRSLDDYVDYDRRFIHLGEYHDCLESQALYLYLCIDTSGSVGAKELSLFVSELQGILACYTTVKVKLYWADAALYGPYDVECLNDVPEPEGGGGTSFEPFFLAVNEDQEFAMKFAIYLTDGDATFPPAPDYDVLWVLTPDSVDPKEIPFGQICKLSLI